MRRRRRRSSPECRTSSGGVKARGLKIIGATIIPRHNRAPAENNTGWNAAKTRIRNEVNHWIRTTAPFDAVIDFDKVGAGSERTPI